jgi:hypothetical protein
MRDTLRLLGIIALAVIIGFSMVACDNGSTTTTIVDDKVPVAADFDIGGNRSVTEGQKFTVTIVPKANKSQGDITIKYGPNGSTTEPTAPGSYPVTFDVAPSGEWKAAYGLAAGIVTINAIVPPDPDKPTPEARFYDITGRQQHYNGDPKIVGIVVVKPNDPKPNGMWTIYYNGSTTAPKDEGDYDITIDVAETSTWNGKTGISLGKLEIFGDDVVEPEEERNTPRTEDFVKDGLGTFNEDGSNKVVYIYPKSAEMSGGEITVYYNGEKVPPYPNKAGIYNVTFDVGDTPTWRAQSGLVAGQLIIVASDTLSTTFFDVTGLNQAYDEVGFTPKPVSVKPKAGHTDLVMEQVMYQGRGSMSGYIKSANPPHQVGEYDVYAIVSGEGYIKEELHFGTLVIDYPVDSPDTPESTDFESSQERTFYYNASMPRVVSIKALKAANDGMIKVVYTNKDGVNSYDAPTDVGVYGISFEVSATKQYAERKAGLTAGTLTIRQAEPEQYAFNIAGLGPYSFDGLPQSVTITSKVLGSIQPYLRVYYQGQESPPIKVGSYLVTFDLANHANWQGVSNVVAGTLEIGKGFPGRSDFSISPKVSSITMTYGDPEEGFSATPVLNVPTTSQNKIAYRLGTGNFVTLDPANPNIIPNGTYSVYVRVKDDLNYKDHDVLLAEKLIVEKRKVQETDIILASTSGALVGQTAYSSVRGITFVWNPNSISDKPVTATNRLPAGVTIPAVNYAPLGTTSWSTGVPVAPGSYTVRAQVNATAASQWKDLQNYFYYTMTIGDLTFGSIGAFLNWYNDDQNGAPPATAGSFRVYNVKFTATMSDIAASGVTTLPADKDYLFGQGITGIIGSTTSGLLKPGNASKRVYLDLTNNTDIMPNTLIAHQFKVPANDTGVAPTNLIGVTLGTNAIAANKDAFAGLGRANSVFTTISFESTAAGFTSLDKDTISAMVELTNLNTGKLTTIDGDELKSLTKLGVGVGNAVTVGAVIDAASVAAFQKSQIRNLRVADVNIPASMFQNQKSLISVVIGDANGSWTAANSIGDDAFNGCSALTTVTFPTSTWTGTIGNRAFRSAANLSVVDIKTAITSIGTEAFFGCPLLTVSMAGPTNGTDAFKGNTILRNVTLYQGVTTVAANAFEGCRSLLKVEFPATLFATINAEAFKDCIALDIDIPTSVTTLQAGAFENCKEIKKITIPPAIATPANTIAERAFKGSGLTAVFIPTYITSIADSAFENCTALTKVTIEEGSALDTIGSTATGKSFAGCTSLATFGELAAADAKKPIEGSLVITGSYTTIRENSFKDTAFKNAIIEMVAGVDYVSTWFTGSKIEKVTFTNDVDPDSITFDLPTIKEIVWDSANEISDDVDFTGLTNLQKLTVSQTLVAAIDGTAFQSRPSFKDLVILANQNFNAAFNALPASVKDVTIGVDETTEKTCIVNIGTTPFSNTVESITFKGEIPAAYIFDGTNNITTPLKIYMDTIGVIPDNILISDKYVTVQLGKDVTDIGANNFRSAALKAFKVDNGNKNYGNYLSDDILYTKATNGALDTLLIYPRDKDGKAYEIPLGIRVIGASAIISTKLEEITIPESVVSIENAAASLTNHKKLVYEAVGATTVTPFNNTLKEVIFGEKVVSIPAPFFENDTEGVKTIDIPNSVAFIAAGANFARLTKLEKVIFRAELLTSDATFATMATITDITIGSEVETIPADTFRATGVRILDLGSVKTIGANAFQNCVSLEGVEIPDSCRSIGAQAFLGCVMLSRVTLPITGINMSLNSWRQKAAGAPTTVEDLEVLYKKQYPTGGPGIYTYRLGTDPDQGWVKAKDL